MNHVNNKKIESKNNKGSMKKIKFTQRNELTLKVRENFDKKSNKLRENSRHKEK